MKSIDRKGQEAEGPPHWLLMVALILVLLAIIAAALVLINKKIDFLKLIF